MSTYINSFKKGFIASSSTIGGWIGYAMGPSLATKIVRPAAQFALRTCYGAPSGAIGPIVEGLLVNLVVSKALPYAVPLVTATGGFLGGAVAAGTIYGAEQAVNKGVSCYRAYDNTRKAEALDRQFNIEDVETDWISVATRVSSLKTAI